jgi:hypothetical protein
MPKEYIECADFGRRVPIVVEEGKPAEFATLDTVAAKVGWTRDRGHVELAVVRCTEGAYDDFDARYMQLDRAGLNRLIRTLRKARDAAFGRDE